MLLKPRYFFILPVTITCLACLLPSSNARAQTDTLQHELERNISAADTSVSKSDKRLYDQIMETAGPKKWKRSLYSLLFKNPVDSVLQKQEGSIDQEYKPYEGFVIKDIHITVLKPFGTDINRPDSLYDTWFNRTANNLHVSTQQYIVRNNLLFKKGDAINPLVMAESEAFLRNTGYILDARINIEPIAGTQEVIVKVVVSDVWSIGFQINSIAFNSFDVEIFDKNFMGVGSNVFIRGIHHGNYDRHFGYGIGYQYKNLLRSFINLAGSYTDDITSKNLQLSAERPIQSTLKYYGQVGYQYFQQRLRVSPWDSISPPQQQHYSITFGRSYKLSSSPYSAKRMTLSARYMMTDPSYALVANKPYPLNYAYTHKDIIIAQLSFFQQRYYRQYLIHSFGITETVPYGYNLSLQLGYNRCFNYFEAPYASVSLSAGKQFSFGNLYASAAIASHFDSHGNIFQGVRKFYMRYYSPLARIREQRVRLFLNFRYASAMHSKDGLTDYIYLNTVSNLQMPGIGISERGTELLMADLEINTFSTLSLLGFRFVFFNFLDAGWMKPYEEKRLIKGNNFVWGLGLGVRIRNEFLVFNTIEFKFGFYPQVHQRGFGDYFNFNSFGPRTQPGFIPAYPGEISLN